MTFVVARRLGTGDAIVFGSEQKAILASGLVPPDPDFQTMRQLLTYGRAVTPRTRGIVINSPCNPTGAVLGDDRMAAIADLGVPLIADEIYHGLVYGPPPRTALAYADTAFVIDGFSKRYAMTGWRLGYIIVPEAFIRPLQKMHQNFFISANAFVQWAGVAALKHAGQDVEQMKQTLDARRRYIIPRLRELGFGIGVEPTGAFYVLANARQFSGDSLSLAFSILEEARVGVTPGIDFGKNAEGYLRFSYANSLDNIKEGMDRIEGYLKRRHPR